MEKFVALQLKVPEAKALNRWINGWFRTQDSRETSGNKNCCSSVKANNMELHNKKLIKLQIHTTGMVTLKSGLLTNKKLTLWSLLMTLKEKRTAFEIELTFP